MATLEIHRYLHGRLDSATEGFFVEPFFLQRPMIDLTSFYKVLQTSGFLHNVRTYS